MTYNTGVYCCLCCDGESLPWQLLAKLTSTGLWWCQSWTWSSSEASKQIWNIAWVSDALIDEAKTYWTAFLIFLKLLLRVEDLRSEASKGSWVSCLTSASSSTDLEPTALNLSLKDEALLIMLSWLRQVRSVCISGSVNCKVGRLTQLNWSSIILSSVLKQFYFLINNLCCVLCCCSWCFQPLLLLWWSVGGRRSNEGGMIETLNLEHHKKGSLQ